VIAIRFRGWLDPPAFCGRISNQSFLKVNFSAYGVIRAVIVGAACASVVPALVTAKALQALQETCDRASLKPRHQSAFVLPLCLTPGASRHSGEERRIGPALAVDLVRLCLPYQTLVTL
jgi:hypothetical protein